MPKFAEGSAPLRPLLSQNNDFVWTPNCENAFQQLKSLLKNIVELRHFDIHRETRIICDASHDGLGAVLEQYSASGWHPISFASRYLNPAAKKYSTNELELLAVEALKPMDQMKPRGQKVNQIRSKPTVEGDPSCFAITKTILSNGNKRKAEYANIHREHTRSLEGVSTCNRRLTNQYRDICIPAEICKCRSKKIRRCSQYVNSSCTIKKWNSSKI